MAVKHSSWTLSKRLSMWVSLNARLSSTSCAIKLSSVPGSDENPSNLVDFESKVRFLRNLLHPDRLVSILDKTPDLDSSIKIFKWASSQNRFKHTADTYHRMILKLGMAGYVEEVEGYCEEMVRKKCPGFEQSLLALVDSFVCNRRLSEALRVLGVMKLTSFIPSIDVFNRLMAALVEGRQDFKDVVFVYKEMAKAEVPPNIDTLNFLMEGLIEAGRVDAAMDQYKRIGKKGCQPNSRTFEIIVSGLCARGHVEESVVVLNEMFQIKCELDSNFYYCVIPIFCKLLNLEMSKRLFKMMRACNVEPDSATYGAMISCLCEHLSVDEALELHEEMISAGLLPEPQVNLDLVNVLCRLERYQDARNFLEEEESVPNASLYNAVLKSCFDTGNLGMAKELFDEMSKMGILDVCSWNVLIRFFCENSLINIASECLGRMVRISFIPNAATYSALIVGNCRIGKIDRALELFSYIKCKCGILDHVSYAELVNSVCRLGNPQDAVELFHYMSSQGCPLQSTSFNLLIEKVCGNGDVKKAMELISLSDHSGTIPSSATYNSILRGLYYAGKQNSLCVMLAQMIIAGCAFDEETYCILIRSKAALNRLEHSVSLLNFMLTNDLTPDSETLACLLSCLVKHSRVYLILSSMDKLVSKNKILDPLVHNMLINSLWREGHKTAARRLLDLMSENGGVPDAFTHALLMDSPEMTSRTSSPKEFGICDSVSSILVEGLEDV